MQGGIRTEMGKNRIAILYICTGRYNVFWKPFYKSFQKYFLKNSKIEYYVFTDDRNLSYKENKDVHINYQEQLVWPYSTLFRFDMFLRLEEKLREYDYVFFFNANSICIDYITEEEFLPYENQLLVMKHPGNYRWKSVSDATFERNPKSMAYVAKGKETVYVQGSLQGGKSNDFMNMVKELSHKIHEDLENGIIACFHDESHLNNYIIEHSDYKLLEPTYMYPQGWILPVRCKIYMFEKRMFMNVLQERGDKEQNVKSDEMKIYRIRAYYEIVKQLLYVKNHNRAVTCFLNRKQINKIAVYGYKELGEILLNELQNTNISVEYIIDRKWKECKEGIPIISPDKVKEDANIDCIIVTCVHVFFEVYNYLSERVGCRILPLDYVVHEAYMDCME